MRNKFQQLKERIKRTKSELGALAIFTSDYLIRPSAGSDRFVIFDINIMFERHEYHVNRLLYHADRFIEIIENFKYPRHEQSQIEPFCTTWNDDRLFFEFDSFIATSSTLFEEPFKKDANECFSSSIYKKFDDIFPNKSSPESLVWRLNIIRNRVVHPDHAAFNENGDRYVEFSSKSGNIVELKDGFPIKITGHLIDIENSNGLKVILKEEVIEKTKNIRKEFQKRKCEFNCSPNLPDFHQIVFMKSKPKGKETKMFHCRGANLFESFISIANVLLDYLTQLHQLFYLSCKERLQTFFPSNWVFYINNEGRVISWGIKTEELSNKEFKTQMELFESF